MKISFEISGKGIDKKTVAKVAESFYQAGRYRQDKYFSVVMIDSKTMRKWNRIYRGKDKVTDVLSFAESDVAGGLSEEAGDLGEILICLTQAKRQAKEYGWSLAEELQRLLVHGLAHLAGYDHENVSQKTAKKMLDFEQKIIADMNRKKPKTSKNK